MSFQAGGKTKSDLPARDVAEPEPVTAFDAAVDEFLVSAEPAALNRCCNRSKLDRLAGDIRVPSPFWKRPAESNSPNREKPRGSGSRSLYPLGVFRPFWDSDPEGLVSQLGLKVISRLLQVQLGVAPESVKKP